MIQRYFCTAVLLGCLFASALKAEKRIQQGMSAEEAIALIDGVELTHEHEIWRKPLIINYFSFIDAEHLRIFQCKTEYGSFYRFLELDSDQKVKNIYKITSYTNYIYDADVMGTFAEVYNTINFGDNYYDVVKKIGYGERDLFYCEKGVWYLRVSYNIGGNWWPIIYFAATGKVAHIAKLHLPTERDPKLNTDRRELEDGSIEFYID